MSLKAADFRITDGKAGRQKPNDAGDYSREHCGAAHDWIVGHDSFGPDLCRVRRTRASAILVNVELHSRMLLRVRFDGHYPVQIRLDSCDTSAQADRICVQVFHNPLNVIPRFSQWDALHPIDRVNFGIAWVAVLGHPFPDSTAAGVVPRERHNRVVREAAPPANFMPGWIALRYLSDPMTALRHFAKIDEGSHDPIVLARAAYWRGRALEAVGQLDEMHAQYEAAARYPTAYYGQLARAWLGLNEIALPPPVADGGRRTVLSIRSQLRRARSN